MQEIKTFNLKDKPDEYAIVETYFNEFFAGLNKNLYDICYYGLTEMINNAIDHSYGNNVTIEVLRKDHQIFFNIIDDGVGAFKRIADLLQSADNKEAVLQLTKGKCTSDPYNHSGEGIFFTSRIFDEFQLIANNLCFIKNNIEDDWFLETLTTPTIGTTVKLKIDINSTKNIKQLFEFFQDPDSYEFNKTEIIVELSKWGDDIYIARSQAKRILKNLDKFKIITLNFKNVRTVGQGFVDEIFRVFKNKHSNIIINYINANEDVLFMIKRSLSTKN